MRFLLIASSLFAAASAHAGGVYFSDRPSGASAIRFIQFGAASPQTIGSASDPRGVVFDPVTERVFFADRGTASLRSYPASGGVAQTHLTGLTSIADLRPDRVNRVFYWCQETSGLIRSAPFTAVDPAVPTTVFSGLASPYYLDLDLAGGRIFWSQEGTSLFQGSIGGGAVTTLYSGGNENRGIAADPVGGFLYWCQRFQGVYRRPIAGGAVQTVYGLGSPTNTNLNTPHGLILDLPARKLYWTDTGSNGSGPDVVGVYRGDLDGSGTREIVFAGSSVNQTWDLDLDTRTPAYAQFRARFFRFDAAPAVTALTADPDADGSPNASEYAFGTSPASGAFAPSFEPLRVNDGGVEYGAIRFRRRAGATDLSYVVQVSTSLPSWDDNSTTPGTTVQFGVATAAEDGMEIVTIRSTVPASNTARQFFRIQVTTP